MTQMTGTEAPQIDYSMLRPGEIRTLQANGFTVRLFSVAGGSFTRVDTRDAAGRLFVERSGNYVFETDALRAYVAVARWVLAQ